MIIKKCLVNKDWIDGTEMHYNESKKESKNELIPQSTIFILKKSSHKFIIEF
jgi:hypothetical protein